MNDFTLQYLKKYGYDDDDVAFLCDTESAMEAAGKGGDLAAIVDRYRADYMTDFKAMYTEVQTLAQEAGVDVFAAWFVWLLDLLEPCYKHAKAIGFPEDIFWENMKDLRYKYVECTLVQKKKGTFVPEWFFGFFQFTRVSFGCLQFELIPAKTPYEKDGVCVCVGDPVVNVHIPRTGGHLPHADALVAYRKAAAYFPEAKYNKKTVFRCSSWLLYSATREILKPTSNLVAFMNDYDIVGERDYDGYGEFWRLFDCLYTGDPDALPADSAFRRGYIARAKAGKPIGSAEGYFIFS